MRQSRFSEEQIVSILHQAKNGITPAETTRKPGISEAIYYRWKKKYSGVSVTELRRLKPSVLKKRILK